MAPLTTCPDDQLLKQCGLGKKAALEELVNRFSGIIYRTVQFSLHRRNVPFTRRDLEDLHNTVFLKLFENGCKRLRQYRGDNGCSVRSWIKLITIRIVIDHLRETVRDADARLSGKCNWEDIPEIACDCEDPLSAIQAAERARLVRCGLSELGPRDSLFLRLHFLEGMSVVRVAKILKISENNAYSVKHRALRRLRAKIGDFLLDLEKN